MGKLEMFDGKSTKWTGLWWHPEYQGFSSAAINLAVVRKFKGNVRLYVRKNRFYNSGENNRPNYMFCLRDANSSTFETLEIDEDHEETKTFTYSQLQDLVDRVACDVGGEGCYGEYLVTDYIDWD